MNVYIVLIIQMCIAGGTHVVAKAVVGTVDPATLTFLRSMFSTAGLMTLFLIRNKRFGIERKDWPKIAWLGFLGLPLNQFLYLYGIGFSTAANGALLYASTPVFVLVFSRFLLKERITAKKTAGILLAFAGIVVVIFERGIDFSSDHTYGNLMILCAVLAWTLFTVQGRPMVIKYGAVKTTALAMTIGMFLFLPVGIFSATRFDFATIDSSHWLGIAYLGLGTSVFGYMLWYYALGKLEASKAAVFANGQPILATILAIIFLQYSITATFVIGGVVTLTGVILTQRG
jgi:drug/metabolite transporter (DMT)-like permease